MPEPIHDATDRRLIEALQAVEAPADLQSRLEYALQIAVRDEESRDTPHLVSVAQPNKPARSPLWNRRNTVAAVVAAGLGGIIFGYRQLTQPLSQAWLCESTQSLLAQAEKTPWRPLNVPETAEIRQSWQALGFLTQVRNIVPRSVCQLPPPLHVQSVSAYDLGNKLVLLELFIERGVQGFSKTLSPLRWARSDVMAMAMMNGQRTLVFAGPPTLPAYILPHRTT